MPRYVASGLGLHYLQSEQHVIQIEGRRGREAQANMEETDRERLPWVEAHDIDPQERSIWRSGVRSTMRAASQLPGKGPTDVDDAPAPAR